METIEKKPMLHTGLHDSSWRGYTIEELRYRRALVLLKLEAQKEKLARDYREMVAGGVVPMTGTSRNIMTKLMGALDYFDYAYIAYKAGGRLLNIVRALRRRKR